MRAIWFRGKSSSDQWVYGSLSKSMDYLQQPAELKTCIDYDQNGTMYSEIVRPETIGQYTGLRDKKGYPIFEGDVLKGYFTTVVEIFWDKENTSFKARRNHFAPYGRELDYFLGYSRDGMTSGEVIGNIHDNPELLEVLK